MQHIPQNFLGNLTFQPPKEGVRRDTHAMSYRVSNVRTLSDEPTAERGTELVIPAGVAAALQAESDMVEDENKALARLRMMERNYAYVKEPIVVSLGDLDFLDM